MPHAAYVGVSGVARKVNKIYIGVGGVARKVKKAYVGVGGVARLVYSSEIGHSVATSLSVARRLMGATTIGNYALFGGGFTNGNTASTVVDAYNTSLVRSNPTGLSTARNNIAAAGNNNYAIFFGALGTPTIDTYNSSLTLNTLSLTQVSYQYGATSHGGQYAICCNGGSSAAFNTSLTKTSLNGRCAEGAAAVYFNGVSRFVGSYDSYEGGRYNYVDEYNDSLTYSQSSWPTTVSFLGAGENGEYAIFGGGSGGTSVYAYNQSGTRVSAPNLNYSMNNYTLGGGVGNLVILTGQQGYNITISDSEAYDTSLTKQVVDPLSVALQRQGSSCTLNGILFFAGGQRNSTTSDVVDIYS